MDDILRTSAVAVNPENAVDDLGDGFTMISVGYLNRTPWDSPRELPEDELATYIAAQAEKAGTTDRVIFNFHVPPHDTPIDQAALLDAEFRPVMKGRDAGDLRGRLHRGCRTIWSSTSRC